jgi:hypothetical protein
LRLLWEHLQVAQLEVGERRMPWPMRKQTA